MFIAAIVLSGLLALAALGAGVPKARLTGSIPRQLQEHMGLSAWPPAATRWRPAVLGLVATATAASLALSP